MGARLKGKALNLDTAAAKRILKRVAERDIPLSGGLIPPPEWELRQRIAALEKRVEEVERRLAAKAGLGDGWIETSK